ncbi:hypothetical protein EW026_g2572 [Hermanssonia centrifuga]|uniref:G-protein coupled receptors family 1 profile domain-containing protein n=1 Tax=Hermanssonia centrifuga TaxID=98765 RepID=A0A4S4KMV7_9APHY|nr:hypothetical protein EW026_g2572 [Hermanssonia centrifuga]
MYSLLGPHPLVLINVSFFFVCLGQLSLILLLGTLCFSKHVLKRNATLINLLVVTAGVTVPGALLYYAQHILDPEPPFGLCLTQAILKHGTDPMFIVCSLALILDVLCETGMIMISITRRTRQLVLLASPYIVFVVFATWAAALGITHPHAVKHQPNDLYCTIAYTTLLLGLDFFVNTVPTHVLPIAYEALMPLATFFIFGTNMDVLKVWKFWDHAKFSSAVDSSKEWAANNSSEQSDTKEPAVQV